jgi:hypothetical protein
MDLEKDSKKGLFNPLRNRSKPLNLSHGNVTVVENPIHEPPLKGDSKDFAEVVENLEQPKKQNEIKSHNLDNLDLQKAIRILAAHGLEVQEPKKVYVKHTYEIEESLHKQFHEMYTVLGFKSVKAAVNDAFRLWIDKNKLEFQRKK